MGEIRGTADSSALCPWMPSAHLASTARPPHTSRPPPRPHANGSRTTPPIPPAAGPAAAPALGPPGEGPVPSRPAPPAPPQRPKPAAVLRPSSGRARSPPPPPQSSEERARSAAPRQLPPPGGLLHGPRGAAERHARASPALCTWFRVRHRGKARAPEIQRRRRRRQVLRPATPPPRRSCSAPAKQNGGPGGGGARASDRTTSPGASECRGARSLASSLSVG